MTAEEIQRRQNFAFVPSDGMLAEYVEIRNALWEIAAQLVELNEQIGSCLWESDGAIPSPSRIMRAERKRQRA